LLIYLLRFSTDSVNDMYQFFLAHYHFGYAIHCRSERKNWSCFVQNLWECLCWFRL